MYYSMCEMCEGDELRFLDKRIIMVFWTECGVREFYEGWKRSFRNFVVYDSVNEYSTLLELLSSNYSARYFISFDCFI